MRISGHALVSEGAPYDDDGKRINIYHPLSQPPGGPRLGCGKCSCGELGPWAESARARRRWQREHKNTVLSPETGP